MMTTKKKVVFAACCSMFVAMISMVTTAVLAYIIRDYASQGVPVSTILLIMTATPLVGIVAAFTIGPISLRVPKKLLLICTQIITIALGIIFVFFAGSCPYWVLILCGGLTGLVSGTLANVPNSLVAEHSESREEAAKYQGWTNATMQGGAAIMSLVGGALGATRWQNAYLLYFAAVPILLIILFMIPMDKPAKPERRVSKGKSKLTGTIPGMVYLRCIQYALVFIVLYTFSVNISSYVITEHELGTSLHTGISSALMTLSAVVAGVTYSKYVKPLGQWFMPVMMLLITAGFACTTFMTGSLAGAYIGAILIGFTKVSIVPYCIGKVTSSSPRRLIPVCISLLMGSMNLGMFVSTNVVEALCKAFFADGVTVDNKFLMSIFIAIAALVFSIALYVPKERAKDTAGA